MAGPQPAVLPLNYGRHASLVYKLAVSSEQ